MMKMTMTRKTISTASSFRDEEVIILGKVSSSQDAVIVSGGGGSTMRHSRARKLSEGVAPYRELDRRMYAMAVLPARSTRGMRMPPLKTTLHCDIIQRLVLCSSMKQSRIIKVGNTIYGRYHSGFAGNVVGTSGVSFALSTMAGGGGARAAYQDDL